MRHRTLVRVRLFIPLFMLALVALACNLGSNPDAGAQVTATSAGAVAGPGTLVALSDVPEVVIQSPADGSEALLYNELQVYATAADKQGVTRIELRVDNLLVDTSASPNPLGSPTLSTILSWTPNTPGPHVLQVVAFRDQVKGNPKSITITVKANAAQITRPAGSPVFLTASPTSDPFCKAVPKVDGLNFREGPGTNYNVMSTLSLGQGYPVTGTNVDRSWYQINVNGQIGWVSAPFITLTGVCDNLFIVAAPIAPTQPPGSTAIVFLPTFTPLPTLPPPPATATIRVVVLPTLTLTPNPGPNPGDMTSTAAVLTATALALTPPPTATLPFVPTQPPPTLPPTPVLPNIVVLSANTGENVVVVVPGAGPTNAAFNVVVANTGGSPAPIFKVGIFLPNGVQVITQTSAPLPPGGQVSVPLTVPFDQPGVQRVLAVADVENIVAESNKSDNTLAVNVTVLLATPVPGAPTITPTLTYTPPPTFTVSPVPSLTPTAPPPAPQPSPIITAFRVVPDPVVIQSDPQNPNAAIPATANAEITVQNNGDGVLNAFTVTIGSSTGQTFSGANPGPVPPGGSVVVTIPMTFTALGTYQLIAQVTAPNGAGGPPFVSPPFNRDVLAVGPTSIPPVASATPLPPTAVPPTLTPPPVTNTVEPPTQAATLTGVPPTLTATATNTVVPPTATVTPTNEPGKPTLTPVPPTPVPPTEPATLTAVPTTAVPPTAVPPTAVPPTFTPVPQVAQLGVVSVAFPANPVVINPQSPITPVVVTVANTGNAPSSPFTLIAQVGNNPPATVAVPAPLQPGQQVQVSVNVQITQPGQQKLVITLSGEGQPPSQSEHDFTAVLMPTPVPPTPVPPTPVPPTPVPPTPVPPTPVPPSPVPPSPVPPTEVPKQANLQIVGINVPNPVTINPQNPITPVVVVVANTGNAPSGPFNLTVQAGANPPANVQQKQPIQPGQQAQVAVNVPIAQPGQQQVVATINFADGRPPVTAAVEINAVLPPPTPVPPTAVPPSPVPPSPVPPTEVPKQANLQIVGINVPNPVTINPQNPITPVVVIVANTGNAPSGPFNLTVQAGANPPATVQEGKPIQPGQQAQVAVNVPIAQPGQQQVVATINFADGKPPVTASVEINAVLPPPTPVPPTPEPPTPVPPPPTAVPPTQAPVPPTQAPGGGSGPSELDNIPPVPNLGASKDVLNNIRGIYEKGKGAGVQAQVVAFTSDSTMSGIPSMNLAGLNLDGQDQGLAQTAQFYAPGFPTGLNFSTIWPEPGAFPSASLLDPGKGQNACQGQAPINCAANGAKPGVVFITVGRDDIAQNKSPDEVKNSLDAAITAAENAGVIPVLSTIAQPLNPADEGKLAAYNKVILQAARSKKVPLLNLYAALRANGTAPLVVNGQPTVGGPNPGSNFTQEGLNFGINVVNYQVLRMLEALRAEVFTK